MPRKDSKTAEGGNSKLEEYITPESNTISSFGQYNFLQYFLPELCLSLLIAGLIIIMFPKAFSSNNSCLTGGSAAAWSSQQSLLASGMCFYFRS